jgi:hypothetical protein
MDVAATGVGGDTIVVNERSSLLLHANYIVFNTIAFYILTHALYSLPSSYMPHVRNRTCTQFNYRVAVTHASPDGLAQRLPPRESAAGGVRAIGNFTLFGATQDVLKFMDGLQDEESPPRDCAARLEFRAGQRVRIPALPEWNCGPFASGTIDSVQRTSDVPSLVASLAVTLDIDLDTVGSLRHGSVASVVVQALDTVQVLDDSSSSSSPSASSSSASASASASSPTHPSWASLPARASRTAHIGTRGKGGAKDPKLGVVLYSRGDSAMFDSTRQMECAAVWGIPLSPAGQANLDFMVASEQKAKRRMNRGKTKMMKTGKGKSRFHKLIDQRPLFRRQSHQHAMVGGSQYYEFSTYVSETHFDTRIETAECTL